MTPCCAPQLTEEIEAGEARPHGAAVERSMRGAAGRPLSCCLLSVAAACSTTQCRLVSSGGCVGALLRCACVHVHCSRLHRCSRAHALQAAAATTATAAEVVTTPSACICLCTHPLPRQHAEESGSASASPAGAAQDCGERARRESNSCSRASRAAGFVNWHHLHQTNTRCGRVRIDSVAACSHSSAHTHSPAAVHPSRGCAVDGACGGGDTRGCKAPARPRCEGNTQSRHSRPLLRLRATRDSLCGG